MHRLLIVPALAALLLVGCHGSSSAPRVVVGRYLFELSYTNFAWGYNHRGMYIDSVGGIHTFEWQRNGERWEPNENETYTASELAAKYAPGAALHGRVESDSMRLMLDYLAAASTGTFSDTTHPMADAGVTRSSLYIYNPADGTYRRVPLRQYGDTRFENLSPSARALADMLDRYWEEARK